MSWIALRGLECKTTQVCDNRVFANFILKFIFILELVSFCFICDRNNALFFLSV